jgi:hypothetical protein
MRRTEKLLRLNKNFRYHYSTTVFSPQFGPQSFIFRNIAVLKVRCRMRDYWMFCENVKSEQQSFFDSVYHPMPIT